MPTALVLSAYGHGTLGRDVLVDAFARGLPGWRITTAAAGPGPSAGRGRGPDRARVATAGPLVATARRALRADALIFGGGTLFTSLHPATGRRMLGPLASAASLSTWASASRRPVALLGVGATTLASPTARVLTRQILRTSRLLVVGDEESVARLVGAGISGPLRVGADPAWVLLEPPLAAHGGGDSVVVVPSVAAARATGGPEPVEMVERLGAALRRIEAAGMTVELRSWDRSGRPAATGDSGPGTGAADRAPGGDAAVVAQLAGQLGPSARTGPPPGTLPDAVESMRSAAVVITARFHGLVAAAAAGAPAVVLSHEPKLTELAARLRQPAVPPDVDATTLARMVLAAAVSGGPDPAAVKHEIAKAEEGFRLLRVLLAGGQTDESDEIGALPLRLWR